MSDDDVLAGLPDPDEYFDHVLDFAGPNGEWCEPGPAARWQASWRRAARQLAAEHLEVVDLACAQGFVVRTAQLDAVGISRWTSRRRVRDGEWTAPHLGVVGVTPPHVGDDAFTARRRRHATQVAAAALVRPRSVAGHRSAAILHGLPTMGVPAVAELAAPLTCPARRHRRSGLPPGEVRAWWGVPVCSVARAVVDVGRLDRRDGIMAADAALRERLVSSSALRAVLAAEAGWVGIRQAREVLALADPRAESPLESITRLAIHDSGLPAPEPQLIIATSGSRAYRVDLAWPGRRFVLECDGRGKYRNDVLWDEKRRQRDLERAGWRVERVIWADVLHDWDEIEALLRAALT